MEKQNFAKYIDEVVIPQMRESLFQAYMEGCKQVHLEDFLRIHNLDAGRVVDFGLPSKTKWIIRNESLSFTMAQKRGLPFPTIEQIEEFIKCKWRYEQYDAWHCHVLGPNGVEIGIFDSCHQKLCIWTDQSEIDDHFYVNGYTIAEYERLVPVSVYAGECFSTLFVLPQNIVG